LQYSSINKNWMRHYLFIRKNVICLIVVLLPYCKIIAQSQEQLVKAAFIEKFTQHINWPNKTSPEHQNEFIIKVIGNQEFCETLTKVYANRKLLDKKVVVECSETIDAKRPADIIFISSNGSSQLENAILECKLSPCLIISESKGLAKKGSHINFYITPNQTLLFEMNKKALDEAGFNPDFLLLDFAKIVEN
jgi:hypothetical protein